MHRPPLSDKLNWAGRPTKHTHTHTHTHKHTHTHTNTYLHNTAFVLQLTIQSTQGGEKERPNIKRPLRQKGQYHEEGISRV